MVDIVYDVLDGTDQIELRQKLSCTQINVISVKKSLLLTII